MIDTSSIRRKVLELAMRGELSERKESDSSSERLYELILEKKNELVKAGIIRKDGKLEKAEAEYDIPQKWIWVKFGKIITLQSGQDLSGTEYNSDNVSIPYMTGASNFCEDGSLVINRWTNKPKAYARRGDILISCKGTVGKLSILDEDEVHIARQIMGIKTYLIDINFAKFFVESGVEKIKAASKGLIPGIERNDILNMNCPLPPIEEQKRIVKRIIEIFAILDSINELQKSYVADIEILRSKLIDAGIQGKLTKQLPEDGTAEELYTIIQNDKARLIKEGKIKKGKRLATIEKNEIPYSIPKNWKWVRVGDVINEVIVPQRDKPIFSGDIPWCRIEDREGILLNGSKSGQYVSEETVKKMNLRVCPVGTVLAACSGASIGTIIVNTVECCTNQTFNGLVCNEYLYNWFLFFYLQSTIEAQKRMGSGSAMAYISQDKFRNMVMPLPPLAEQKRIVHRINEILSIV